MTAARSGLFAPPAPAGGPSALLESLIPPVLPKVPPAAAAPAAAGVDSVANQHDHLIRFRPCRVGGAVTTPQVTPPSKPTY